MKKVFVILSVLCIFTLSACAHIEPVNLLHFTDNLNDSYGYGRVSLSDYMIKDGEYTLLLKEGATEFLLTLSENEEGKIKSIRFTVGKTDDKGKFKAISDEAAKLYYENAAHILSAFSMFDYDECAGILSQLIPRSGSDFSKTGELTAQWNNFSLAYYSNGLCCQLYATDNYLEETESTSKPVSRPAYGQTAHIRED